MTTTYTDGVEVELLDKVLVHNADVGVVVGLIAAGQFSPSYPAGQWLYLERGILIESPNGLLHFPDVSSEVKLLSRAEKKLS
jgi:hypothetical protein